MRLKVTRGHLTEEAASSLAVRPGPPERKRLASLRTIADIIGPSEPKHRFIGSYVTRSDDPPTDLF
jgi:hypothetical protein